MNALGVLILAAKPIFEEETAGLKSFNFSVDTSEEELLKLEEAIRDFLRGTSEKSADKIIENLLDAIYSDSGGVLKAVLIANFFPRKVLDRIITRIKDELPGAWAAAVSALGLRTDRPFPSGPPSVLTSTAWSWILENLYCGIACALADGIGPSMGREDTHGINHELNDVYKKDFDALIALCKDLDLNRDQMIMDLAFLLMKDPNDMLSAEERRNIEFYTTYLRNVIREIETPNSPTIPPSRMEIN